MRIRYYCHYGATGGYGRAARDYLAALVRLPQAQLEIACFGEKTVSPEDRYRHLDDLATPFALATRPCDVVVVHAQPRFLATIEKIVPDFRQGLHSTVAITTWETSRMPVEYQLALSNMFDHVIVPSTFCQEAIDTHGIASPGVPDITVVPHCFDPDFWREHARDKTEPKSGRTYFYSMGAWGDRKNQLGVLKAYLGEFSANDPVELTHFDELRATIAASGLPLHDLPALTIPDTTAGELHERNLIKLHQENHCFVSATRGEGFGLGLFEAAILSKEIISPLWGGHSDFLDEYSAHRYVPHFMTPCFGTLHATLKNGQPVLVVDKPPGTNCKQLWAEPDLGTLASEMRKVANDRAAGRLTMGTPDDRADLEARFSYKTVGPMLLNALQGATPR